MTGEPAIETNGLTKRYDGTTALDGLSLRVEQGEIFGFLGPNGAGKTTTIRLLLDMIRPTSGSARVLGMDCQRDSAGVRAATGYLPGDLRLYGSLTGAETVDLIAAGRAGLVLTGLRDVSGGAIGAAAGGLAIITIDVLLYPSYRDALGDFEYPAAIRGMLGEAGSIASPEGFLTPQFFTFVPLVLILVAIAAGTGATAGEEAAGTLELLLAQPLSRKPLLARKCAGMAFGLALAALAPLPAFVICRPIAGMEISTVRFMAALLNVIPLLTLFFCLSLLCGAVLANRATAALAASAVLVASFVLHTLGSASDFFDALQRVSPLYWADASQTLIHGFDSLRFGGLAATALALFVLALLAFERREVGVGERRTRLVQVGPGRRQARRTRTA